MMPDAEFLKWLYGVGSMGLAFVLHQVLSGKLITKREYESTLAERDKKYSDLAERLERTEAKLDKALEYGHRAVAAGQTLIEKSTSG